MTATDPARVALYLHVPFCASKCAYCDFVSASDADAEVPDTAMWAIRGGLGADATRADAYCAAVSLYLQEFVESGLLSAVPSVYVGGGTPSVLGDRLPALLRQVLTQVTLAPGAEVTVEANPDSLTPELAASLVAAGVNRFSLGVQSFDDHVLATLGRCHDANTAETVARYLVATGARVSVDLMCGVPGQSEESFAASVDRAIRTGAGHVSVYPLSIEEGTALAARIDAGDLDEPDPDVAARMMEGAARLLADAGLERYEVASYARDGERAVHNVGYWTGVPYLGVGPSAASMLPVPLACKTPVAHYVRTWPEGWRVRFVMNDSNESFLGYLWDHQPDGLEALSEQDALREDAMLGLRMTEGIGIDLARAAGVTEALETLAAEGLVVADPRTGRWVTTPRGWLLGNEVFGRVWTTT